MDTSWKYNIVFLVLLMWNALCHASSSRQKHPWGIAYHSEYCDFEIFKAQCGSGQIIVLQSAMYGHMKIGRCIESDVGGHLGCKADVGKILGEQCSGKQNCEMHVDDEKFRQTKPCIKGISLYLDVSFTCMKTVPREYVCNSIPAQASKSYISSMQIFKRHCPKDIEIDAKEGQKIKVTIIDLLADDKEEKEIGYIVDADGSNIGPISIGKQESVQLSTSNKISLIIDGSLADHQFVLAYQAIGCPDFTAPFGTTIQREENEAVVTCSYTQLTWKLTCRGDQWLGVIGNCSKPVISEAATTTLKPKVSSKSLRLPKDVIYLIIVCSTIFLSVLVITIGFVSLKRARIMQKCREQKDHEKEWDQGTTKMILIPKPRPNSDYLTPRCNPEGQGESASIYDTPLPDPPPINSLNRGTVKRNNEEDYINTMSSNSTDYTRKYFVLDKDYMNTNNLMDA